MKRRVVITGAGTINALGLNVNETLENLYAGKNGIGEITRFDHKEMKVHLAYEVKNYDPKKYFSPKQIRSMDKFIQFGVIAAKEAMETSGLKDFDPMKFGVIVSSGIGGLQTIEDNYDKGLNKGFDRVSPHFIPMVITNLAAGNIAIEVGAKGLCTCPVTACSGGSNAIGDAFRQIRDGYLDYVLAGGCEASITKLGIGGFTSMGALTKESNPNRASIPFDKERSGFVMGEGAGILMLEEYEHAIKRNANILCEIVGYGVSSDAYHITSPCLDGEGAKNAMTSCLNDANVSYQEVTYINAHGTSTPLNDKTESLAIQTVFKNHPVYVSSTKSSTGHCLAAAGGIEAIFSVYALNRQMIPQTINYKEYDEECAINLVHTNPLKTNVDYVMSNSLGFGGHNASLLFKRYENGTK